MALPAWIKLLLLNFHSTFKRVWLHQVEKEMGDFRQKKEQEPKYKLKNNYMV